MIYDARMQQIIENFLFELLYVKSFQLHIANLNEIIPNQLFLFLHKNASGKLKVNLKLVKKLEIYCILLLKNLHNLSDQKIPPN
jgi:hypothetical protein